MAIVGTSVREKKYDASMAKTTASASGTNRNFATPVRKNIGTNTMQMHSVETKAGIGPFGEPVSTEIRQLVVVPRDPGVSGVERV